MTSDRRCLIEIAGPKRLSVIEAAGHNDWVDHIDDRWWDEAVSFLLDGSASP